MDFTLKKKKKYRYSDKKKMNEMVFVFQNITNY